MRKVLKAIGVAGAFGIIIGITSTIGEHMTKKVIEKTEKEKTEKYFNDIRNERGSNQDNHEAKEELREAMQETAEKLEGEII